MIAASNKCLFTNVVCLSYQTGSQFMLKQSNLNLQLRINPNIMSRDCVNWVTHDRSTVLCRQYFSAHARPFPHVCTGVWISPFLSAQSSADLDCSPESRNSCCPHTAAHTPPDQLTKYSFTCLNGKVTFRNSKQYFPLT